MGKASYVFDFTVLETVSVTCHRLLTVILVGPSDVMIVKRRCYCRSTPRDYHSALIEGQVESTGRNVLKGFEIFFEARTLAKIPFGSKVHA